MAEERGAEENKYNEEEEIGQVWSMFEERNRDFVRRLSDESRAMVRNELPPETAGYLIDSRARDLMGRMLIAAYRRARAEIPRARNNSRYENAQRETNRLEFLYARVGLYINDEVRAVQPPNNRDMDELFGSKNPQEG